MSAVLTSPEDICNDALVRIGYKGVRIGSMYEGSPASIAALAVYGQTRDELLRSDDWGFAERNVALTLLKTAPPGGYSGIIWSDAYPVLPWRYEYAYPDDTLEVRSIRSTPLLIPNFDPKPNVWRIAHASGARVILSNVVNAILIYTGQIHDPLNWEPLFTETLCAAVARRLSESLAKLDPALSKAEQGAITRGQSESIDQLERADELGESQVAQRIQG